MKYTIEEIKEYIKGWQTVTEDGVLHKDDVGLSNAISHLSCGQDGIKALTKRLKKPFWVKASEQLPELHENVLITNGMNIGHARLTGHYWKVCASNDIIHKGDVMYWMPMPTPPL